VKNYTTPRTLADCQWTTGYSSAPRSVAREALSYVLFVAFILALLFGAHIVAVIFGGG
jgi:hypothetical protein